MYGAQIKLHEHVKFYIIYIFMIKHCEYPMNYTKGNATSVNKAS